MILTPIRPRTGHRQWTNPVPAQDRRPPVTGKPGEGQRKETRT